MPEPNQANEESFAEKKEAPVKSYNAWLVVLGAWFGIIAASGSRSTLGTIQTYVLENQLSEMDESSVAWIFSFYTFNSLAWGLVVGPAFDVYGSRWLLLGGSVILCLAFFLLGECTQYWHFFLVVGLLGGTDSCLVHTTCYASIGQWFETQRATASGFAATGSSVGGVIFISALQSLFPKLGFGWSIRIMAFIMLFLCILSNILVRSRGVTELEPGSWKPSFKIFKSPTLSLTAAGIWFLEWGYFVPTGYLSAYALAHGFEEGISYQILAIFFASAFFGRFIPGMVADRVGRFNTLIFTVAICTILPFALWWQVGNSKALLILFAVLFGFWSACDTSLTPPCLGQLCESKDYGRYYAGAFSVSSFAPLTSLPIAGALISRTAGSYWGLILFTGLNYGVAAICFVLARGAAVGFSLKKVF